MELTEAKYAAKLPDYPGEDTSVDVRFIQGKCYNSEDGATSNYNLWEVRWMRDGKELIFHCSSKHIAAGLKDLFLNGCFPVGP